MSQGNVDRFIEMMGAFNRLSKAPEAADPRDLQDLLGVMDRQVHFEPQQAALEGGYAGHEGVMQWLADLVQHYERGHVHYADIRDLEDEVLALGTLRFTGRGSGIKTEAPVAVLARFRNGLVTHFRDYGDKAQALEAAGLSE
jgi:ketosteroid isomerase-like protein